jgi:uncharacterized protein YjiS (DUF1127 family)
MEIAMLKPGEIDFSTIDYRTLTPEQWVLMKKRLVAQAHAGRSQILRDSLAALRAILRRFAGAAMSAGAGWYATFLAWRGRRAAIGELRALNDRMLRDIGINRYEIEGIVHATKAKPKTRMTVQETKARIAACALPFSAPGRPGFISAICSSAGGRTPMSR